MEREARFAECGAGDDGSGGWCCCCNVSWGTGDGVSHGFPIRACGAFGKEEAGVVAVES